MNTIVAPSNTVTMSSREISQLCEKEHKNVKRDAQKMLSELGLDALSFERIYLDDSNRRQTEFFLDRILTETLLTGYSVPLRHRVVTRLNELENVSRHHVTTDLPDFSSPAAAARAWAEQYERTQEASKALALAAPKAEFVDRYVDATGLLGFRQVAKVLKANERSFRQMLIDTGVMYYLNGDLMPKQAHIDAGRFDVKTGTSERNSRAFAQARFTPKGVEWIAGKWATYNMQRVA